MLRAQTRIYIGIALLTAFFISAITISFSSAETTANNWFTSSPSFRKITDSTSPLPNIADACIKSTVPVSRGLNSSFEEHCFVPTAMGLMSQIYYNQGVVQPQGYTKAYPLNYVAGGNPTIKPVPNQASGVYYAGNRNGQGVLLGLFTQISNHTKLTVNQYGASYDINGADQMPDYVFKYGGGQSIAFSGSLAFSTNGRYMVSEALNTGFMRINLMNVTYQPYSKSYPTYNSATTPSSASAISDDGKIAFLGYGAIGSGVDPQLKVVNVDTCDQQLPNQPQALQYNCQETQLLPGLKQILPTLQNVDMVKIVNDHTVLMDVRYLDGPTLKYSRYAMTVGGQTESLKQYLALGDSYISGEGAHSYRGGTDTLRNQCHQSLVSYPYLLGSIFTSSASVACSGARMHNVVVGKDDSSDQLIGNEPALYEVSEAKAAFLPGVIAQKNFISDINPQAITISIGGNDIGFGQILEKCVHPLKNLAENANSNFTCYGTYEDRAEVVNTINSQFTKLRSLYESMRDNGMGGRRVYVIGYPQIAKVGSECGANVQMNADEIVFARDLISYLNSVIKRAANEAGVQYVDTEQAFNGNRLCEAPAGQSAINGFTISNTAGGGHDFKASFHPNQRGHQMLATAIAEQTANLTKPMPTPLAKTHQITLDPNATILQNVPKTNRVIRYVRVADNLVDKVLDKTAPLKMVLEAQDYLTKAGGVYNLVINSTPVNIGSYTADANGNLSIEATIPTNMTPGFHTLHIYGNDSFNNPIDIQQVIFVTSSPDDSDGDGITNNIDSCVLAAQSGLDADKDNIDDICDPLISTPPVTDPDQEPGGIVWQDNAVLPISIQAVSGP